MKPQMQTIKITSTEHLNTLLNRTVKIQNVSKRDGLGLVTHSRIPFLKNYLHLTTENLAQVWPDAVRVLASMETLYAHTVDEHGVDILSAAFNQTRYIPDKAYLLLDEGFMLVHDISAISYTWPEETIVFKTYTDRTIQSTVQSVSRNYPEVPKLLKKFYDMNLSSVESANVVKSNINFARLTNGKRVIERPEVKAPDDITAILAISSLLEDPHIVHYATRKAVDGRIAHYCYPVDDLEMWFPHSKQALLAVASLRCPDDITRAAFMRHWWRSGLVHTTEPLWFLLEDEKRMGHLDLTSYFLWSDHDPEPYAKPFTQPVKWSNLHSVENSGFPLKQPYLLFKTEENKIVHSSVDAPQSEYLGLDKILALVESLGLEGTAAAGPVYQALVKPKVLVKNPELPDISFDPSLGL